VAVAAVERALVVRHAGAVVKRLPLHGLRGDEWSCLGSVDRLQLRGGRSLVAPPGGESGRRRCGLAAADGGLRPPARQPRLRRGPPLV
jgi:hypothetical protein